MRPARNRCQSTTSAAPPLQSPVPLVPRSISARSTPARLGSDGGLSLAFGAPPRHIVQDVQERGIPNYGRGERLVKRHPGLEGHCVEGVAKLADRICQIGRLGIGRPHPLVLARRRTRIGVRTCQSS